MSMMFFFFFLLSQLSRHLNQAIMTPESAVLRAGTELNYRLSMAFQKTGLEDTGKTWHCPFNVSSKAYSPACKESESERLKAKHRPRLG